MYELMWDDVGIMRDARDLAPEAVELETSTHNLVQVASEGFNVGREPVKLTRVRPDESLVN